MRDRVTRATIMETMRTIERGPRASRKDWWRIVALVVAAQAYGEVARADDLALERVRVRATERELRAERLLRAAERIEALDPRLLTLGLSSSSRPPEEALLDVADPALTGMRQRLERRLVALYKTRAIRTPPFAPGLELGPALRKAAALKQVAVADSRWLRAYRVRLEERAAERSQGRQGRAGADPALIAQRNRADLLRIRADRHRRIALDLRRLATRMTRREADATPTLPGLERGRIPPPVDAPVRRAFGLRVHPEFQTRIWSTGVEFESRPGARVRAVGDAEVRFAGTLDAYDGVVILDHGRGTTSVSGRLGQLSVTAGQTVRKGEVVGSVAAGARLYFELRSDREPVDPELWLDKRARPGSRK